MAVMDYLRGVAGKGHSVGKNVLRETLGETAALGYGVSGDLWDLGSVPMSLVSPSAGRFMADQAGAARSTGGRARRWGREGWGQGMDALPQAPAATVAAPSVPTPPPARPDLPPEAPDPARMPGALPDPLSERVLRPTGREPGAVTQAFMEDRYTPGDRYEAPPAPQAGQGMPEIPPTPETGVFVGGERWRPQVPSTPEQMAAAGARAAEGRAAREGWNAEYGVEPTPAGMQAAARLPAPPESAWDDYNRRVRNNAIAAGIARPESEQEMARWAAGEARRSGQARYSGAEREASGRNAADYYGRQEREQDRESRERMVGAQAQAEGEGDFTTTPTGAVFNRRTGEVVYEAPNGGGKLSVVNGALVNEQGDVLYKAPDDEKIMGMSTAEFEKMNSPMSQFYMSQEQKDEWREFASRWMKALVERGSEERPAGASGGTQAGDVAGIPIFNPDEV